MANVIEFTEPADLIAKYDELSKTDNFFIVYLTGGIDPNTGVSWCSDCVENQPHIDSGVLNKTQLTVLKGIVNDKTTWMGVADHPYKAHPILKAGGVPSVILLQGPQALMRAESGDDFKNEDLMESIATGN